MSRSNKKEATTMKPLDVIKHACTDALEKDNPSADAAFHDAVDPGSVLELAGLVETLLMYVEKQDDLTARELAAKTRHSLAGEPGGGV